MTDNGKTLREKQQQEVDANYEALQERLPELLSAHAGKFALMQGGKIIQFFESDKDAWAAGKMHFKDDVFSVQKIGDQPVKLGWMGYALFHRTN